MSEAEPEVVDEFELLVARLQRAFPDPEAFLAVVEEMRSWSLEQSSDEGR